MPNPDFDRKKVRRAMLAAPAVGALGIFPFIFQLNLSFVQFLLKRPMAADGIRPLNSLRVSRHSVIAHGEYHC